MAQGCRALVIGGAVGVMLVFTGFHLGAKMQSSEAPQRISSGPEERFGVQYPYDEMIPGHRSVLNVGKQNVAAADAGRPEDAVRQLAGDRDSDPADPAVIKV